MPVTKSPSSDQWQSPDNQHIAENLEELAELLQTQGAHQFRVRAYRIAADQLRHMTRPVHEILKEDGMEGLLALPSIGKSLARSIKAMCSTGRIPLLQRLRGESGPEHLFMTLPGIGPEYAARIHDQLGIENLPELEVALRDGRLAKVPGMGRKRLQAIRETLQSRLHMSPVIVAQVNPVDNIPVAELLNVDREYREKAATGELRMISPRRNNPTGQAWLPVMHTQREGRHYTALFSNTTRAHDMGMTHDWVILYRDDHDGHGQWTVLTSQFGPLKGHRIIRGREPECGAYYQSAGTQRKPT